MSAGIYRGRRGRVARGLLLSGREGGSRCCEMWESRVRERPAGLGAVGPGSLRA